MHNVQLKVGSNINFHVIKYWSEFREVLKLYYNFLESYHFALGKHQD